MSSTIQFGKGAPRRFFSASAHEGYSKESKVFHRAILVASAIFFATSMSPAAHAGCGGGCGFEAAGPAMYAPPVYAQPIAIPAPVPPPMAVAPAPIAVDHWDTGGCGTLGGCIGGCGAFGVPACGGGCGFGGCGGFNNFGGCNCGRSVAYAPSPLYVVDQGPDYSGPGMFLPYRTYAPGAAYAPAINYPYVGPRYGYRAGGYYRYRGYRRPRYAYRARVYVRPRPYLYR